jgi:hypothetical protein
MAFVLDLSTPLSLSEILGSAMAAVIDAQAQSARASVEFIQDVGIIPPAAPGGEEKLRMVQFRYRKLDENQKEADFMVEIPLLGLVDVPMVSVKTATFSFSYDVSDTAPGQKTTPTVNVASTSFLSKLTIPATIKGRVGRTPSPSTGSEKASLQVKVELEKSAMPVGLEKILDILEVAAAERKQPPVG